MTDRRRRVAAGPPPRDVQQGTLTIMILKTLETMGPLHGYGIARRIEQTSGSRLTLKYGTLYPALLKLELAGYVTSAWAVTETRRQAKFYRLTRAGRKKIEDASRDWQETADILARFLAPARRSS
jgi:PadR family transcriptional regulator PadR